MLSAMHYTVTFLEYEVVTEQATQLVLSFPFTIVDSDLIGSPEERSLTQTRKVIVTVSHHKRIIWNRLGLANEDLPKVLFEYAKRYVKQIVESDSLPNDYTIPMPMITDNSHPGPCQFEISRLRMPDGVTIEAEAKPSMGFHT